MKKDFFSYVLPSLFAFIFSGLYSVIDGLFIGQTLGDIGLGAIGFAYPVVALIQATGTGIGIGGAVAISIALGKKDSASSKSNLGNSLVLLAIASAILTLLLLIFAPLILSVFGAKGAMLTGAKNYLTVIIMGTTFQLFATGIAPLIRTYGKSLSAMFAMIIGFLVNILLDWLFIPILGLGLIGGALATIIGQLLTFLICLFFIFDKIKQLHLSDYRLQLNRVKDLLSTGLSPFGATISPFIVIVAINKAAAFFGGDGAIAAYTVANYIVSFVFLTLQGISDGVQPLISFYFGQKNHSAVLHLRKLAYYFTSLVALFCTFVVIVFRFQLTTLFGASKDTVILSSFILFLYAGCFILMGFLRISAAYFYATKNNPFAYLIIYGEPVIAILLLTFAFPQLFGLNGVWYTMPVTYLLLIVVAFLLLLLSKKKG